MSDDLLARLTTALMDAMGCRNLQGIGCESHRPFPALLGVPDDGWPCPAATRYAEALLPFVRDEIADAIVAWVADMERRCPDVGVGGKQSPYGQAGMHLLAQARARAEEVRRG